MIKVSCGFKFLKEVDLPVPDSPITNTVLLISFSPKKIKQLQLKKP
jgi:hypothetical protein